MFIIKNINKFINLVGKLGFKSDFSININKGFVIIVFNIIANFVFKEIFKKLKSSKYYF